MRKYYSWNIALIIVCFCTAFGIERYMSKDRCLMQYSNEISTKLSALEQDCDDLLSEQSPYLNYYFCIDISPSAAAFALDKAEKINNKPYTLFLLNKDSVISVSNNLVALDTSLQDNSFVKLSNGYYFVKKKTYPSIDSGLQAIALILIKRDYNANSDYINNTFEVDSDIPESISMDAKVVSSYPIYSKSGQTLAFLDSDKPTMSHKLQIWVYVLYVLGFVLVLILGQIVAQQMKKKYHSLSLALLVFVFVLVAFGYHFMDFGAHFSSFVFLQPSFMGVSGYSGSLSDVMVSILLLLWFLSYVFNNYSNNNLGSIHRFLPWFITVAEHILVVFCGFMAVSVHRLLINSSTFVFDFNDLYKIDGFNIASIVCILLVWFIYTLVVYHSIKSIHRFGLPDFFRSAISPAIAVGIGVFSLSYFNLGLTAIQISISLYAFIVLFDIFMTSHKASNDYMVSWGLFGITIYAFASAILLNTFRDLKNNEKYTAYVNTLNEQGDNKALENIKKITQVFENQKVKDAEDAKKQLSQLFNNNAYLPDHYTLDIRSTNVVLDSSIRNFTNTYSVISYITDCQNRSLGDSIWYRMEVVQKNESKANCYHEDLFKTPFSNLEANDDLEFAIYQGDVCINKSKKFDTDDLAKIAIPSVQSTHIVSLPTKNYYVGNFDKNKIIYVSHSESSILKYLYLASYLFLLMVGLVFLLWLITKVLSIATRTYQPTQNASLRYRIQTTFVSLTIFSGAILLVSSVVNMNNLVERNYKDQLGSKSRSVEMNIENVFSKLNYLPLDSLGNISKIINDISMIHDVDVDLYDLAGNLISNSDKDIFRKGIVAPRMNGSAYHILDGKKNRNTTLDESIGNLDYKTAYFSINDNNDNLIAYAALPLYSREKILKAEQTQLLGLLMSSFILLIIPAVILSSSISKKITQPLKIIGEKLMTLTNLDEVPTKIDIKINDSDLSPFVEKYNTMIEHMSEKDDKLKNMARLESWRDMAKIVAHDIKNPLTPLKMLIQMLPIFYARDSREQFSEKLIRTCKSVETQIEQILRMVEDFTSVNTPQKTTMERLSINNLLNHVYTTYMHADPNVALDFELPTADYFVYADKSQLMRLFDNLVKNGLQAVQAKQVSGRVSISLYNSKGEDRMIGIKVSDTGNGIPKDIQSKVFMPNFTTKTGGSGYGLAVCKNMVTAANGTIDFKSEVGIGTDFYVELPLVEDEV